MADHGFEVICQNCRGAVPSLAQTCPHCGRSMFGPPPSTVVSSFQGEEAFAIPPLAPARRIDLGESTRLYGGFWIRVLAALVDSFILLIPALLIQRALGPQAGILSAVVDWLYYAGFESSTSRATLGKMACGLSVTDMNGSRISFGRATGRYFAKILSAIPLGLGFAMVGWTRQKRGLHDFIAGTMVVRG
jgi:uncharacterized RDD family membrane protein YckC